MVAAHLLASGEQPTAEAALHYFRSARTTDLDAVNNPSQCACCGYRGTKPPYDKNQGWKPRYRFGKDRLAPYTPCFDVALEQLCELCAILADNVARDIAKSMKQTMGAAASAALKPPPAVRSHEFSSARSFD